MPTSVRSFAKINIGLCIGPLRPDGFHELRTVYQTVALHDVVHIRVKDGSGIEVRCEEPCVPLDGSNTCFRIAERVVEALEISGKVVIEIEKELPVQGGLGAGSSNAVATMLALEHELGRELSFNQKMKIAAEVGSDLPLFLIGGTVLGVGRGEEVYAAPDLPPMPCVIAMPKIAVSTPAAFAAWDRWIAEGSVAGDAMKSPVHQPATSGAFAAAAPATTTTTLTHPEPSDRINQFSCAVFLWLNGFLSRQDKVVPAGPTASGVPVGNDGGRAETPLLDLVRTGIANDFEQVVFPLHPKLDEVKQALQRSGALYASLSGSGSAVYGLFDSAHKAENAAGELRENGISAQVTTLLDREQYWQQVIE
jgi:4-diphosphocytidyl-2-C-methyl-D-erythritol kinase